MSGFKMSGMYVKALVIEAALIALLTAIGHYFS